MQRRLLICWRDRHETAHIELQLIPAQMHEVVDLARQHTGLLRLLAGIDLKKHRKLASQPGHFLAQLARQLFPVDGLDDIKKRNRLAHLVGLERADKMQFNIPPALAQGGPFPGGLLNTVFTKNPLARLQNRLNTAEIVGF